MIRRVGNCAFNSYLHNYPALSRTKPYKTLTTIPTSIFPRSIGFPVCNQNSSKRFVDITAAKISRKEEASNKHFKYLFLLISAGLGLFSYGLYNSTFKASENALDQKISADYSKMVRARHAEMFEKVLENTADVSDEDVKLLLYEERHTEATLVQALKALKQDKITSSQMATMCLFWSALNTHGIDDCRCISIFNHDGTINIKAKEAFAQGLSLGSKKNEEFYEKLRLLPKSEQRFLITSRITNWEKTISWEICGRLGLNYLAYLHEDKRMVPSVGMMQAFIDTVTDGTTVKINPVFGASTFSEIRQNGLSNERDMGIPSPWKALPNEADGFPAPAYDFSYHDFYHALTVSCCGEKYRKMFIAISDSLGPNDDPHIKKIKNRLRDLETSFMRSYVLFSVEKSIERDREAFLCDVINELRYFKTSSHYNQLCEKTVDALLDNKDSRVSDETILKDLVKTSLSWHSFFVRGFPSLLPFYPRIKTINLYNHSDVVQKVNSLYQEKNSKRGRS